VLQVVMAMVILVCATFDGTAAETPRFFFARRNCHGRCCCFSRPLVPFSGQRIRRAGVQADGPFDVNGVDRLNRFILDLGANMSEIYIDDDYDNYNYRNILISFDADYVDCCRSS